MRLLVIASNESVVSPVLKQLYGNKNLSIRFATSIETGLLRKDQIDLVLLEACPPNDNIALAASVFAPLPVVAIHDENNAAWCGALLQRVITAQSVQQCFR